MNHVQKTKQPILIWDFTFLEKQLNVTTVKHVFKYYALLPCETLPVLEKLCGWIHQPVDTRLYSCSSQSPGNYLKIHTYNASSCFDLYKSLPSALEGLEVLELHVHLRAAS